MRRYLGGIMANVFMVLRLTKDERQKTFLTGASPRFCLEIEKDSIAEFNGGEGVS